MRRTPMGTSEEGTRKIKRSAAEDANVHQSEDVSTIYT